MPINYEFPHYLAAKRTVDDRALNRNVWAALAGALNEYRGPAARPLAVLEVACGTGTMVERTLEWGLFDGCHEVHYTAIDSLPANIAAGKGAPARAAPLVRPATLKRPTYSTSAAERHEQERYDLVIAHAFLDLLDIPERAAAAAPAAPAGRDLLLYD